MDGTKLAEHFNSFLHANLPPEQRERALRVIHRLAGILRGCIEAGYGAHIEVGLTAGRVEWAAFRLSNGEQTLGPHDFLATDATTQFDAPGGAASGGRGETPPA